MESKCHKRCLWKVCFPFHSTHKLHQYQSQHPTSWMTSLKLSEHIQTKNEIVALVSHWASLVKFSHAKSAGGRTTNQTLRSDWNFCCAIDRLMSVWSTITQQQQQQQSQKINKNHELGLDIWSIVRSDIDDQMREIYLNFIWFEFEHWLITATTNSNPWKYVWHLNRLTNGFGKVSSYLLASQNRWCFGWFSRIP